MTNTFTQHLCAALMVITALSSCHRPVAYFQPELINLPASVNPQSVAAPVPNQAIASKTHLSINAPIVEAYAQNDNKPVISKSLGKRIERVQTLLTSIQKTESPGISDGNRKIGMVERLMVRKMNKKLSQRLAPAKPEKAMVERIKLFGGILLLIVGVVIMLAAPTSILFLGIILSLAGIVGIIAGLFGIS